MNRIQLIYHRYAHGFARFCNARYTNDRDDIANPYIHLTNVAIQKNNDDYNSKHGGKWHVRVGKVTWPSRPVCLPVCQSIYVTRLITFLLPFLLSFYCLPNQSHTYQPTVLRTHSHSLLPLSIRCSSLPSFIVLPFPPPSVSVFTFYLLISFHPIPSHPTIFSLQHNFLFWSEFTHVHRSNAWTWSEQCAVRRHGPAHHSLIEGYLPVTHPTLNLSPLCTAQHHTILHYSLLRNNIIAVQVT